jgi:cell division protein FtsQ
VKRTIYLFFLVPICLLSALTAAYLFSRTEPIFLLKNIRIKGASQLSESEILAKIYPFIKKSIFGTDMGKVKEAITSHPFIKDVRVKRVFPFSILIDVNERAPSALWIGSGGDIRMLDESGQAYRSLTKGDAAGLFAISTSEKNEARSVFREVSSWDQQGIMKKDAISEVVYREGNMTVFSLDGGVEIILGKEDHRERLKRALAVLDDARRRGLLIRCIDARFEKGAIVKERTG